MHFLNIIRHFLKQVKSDQILELVFNSFSQDIINKLACGIKQCSYLSSFMQESMENM